MAEIQKLRRHLLHGDDSLSVFRNRLNIKVSLRANKSCITVYIFYYGSCRIYISNPSGIQLLRPSAQQSESVNSQVIKAHTEP